MTPGGGCDDECLYDGDPAFTNDRFTTKATNYQVYSVHLDHGQGGTCGEPYRLRHLAVFLLT